MLQEIPLDKIHPSPFQHRRVFDSSKLAELAESIKAHGLIQPITVRSVKRGYELVCGERRWRAMKLVDFRTITAFVRDYGDKQARIACLSENVQRTDLSPIEQISAVAEWVDAYMDEHADGYEAFLRNQIKKDGKGRRYKVDGRDPDLKKPLHRVAYLLALVESDRKNGTDFSSNFTAILADAFSELKKGIEPISFATNDLPLLVRLERYEHLKEFAIQKGLGKSQTEALIELTQSSPKDAKEILKTGKIEVGGEEAPISEVSAREIKGKAFELSLAHVGHNSGNEQWYTPDEYLDAARTVLAAFDLDPASSDVAQKRVKAKKYFTIHDDGLNQEWRGRVWLNPPYSDGVVDQFMDKLCGALERGEVEAAITLTNNCTETKWFQRASALAKSVCFPSSRIKFLNPAGEPVGAPLQGQALLYFGKDVSAFRKHFECFGTIWVA